jgi:hypothetical protein
MIRRLLIPLVAALCVLGCATPPRPAPLSLAEIISMSKAGLRDAEIIKRVDQSRTVYRLTSADVLLLRQEGVSEGVVNYLLDRYTRYEVNRAEDYYRSRFDYGFGFGYWYQPHPHRRW